MVKFSPELDKNFSKIIGMQTGQRHTNVLANMLNIPVSRFEVQPGQRYTSVILPVTGTAVNERIDNIARECIAQLAHLDPSLRELDLSEEHPNRHTTLIGVKEGEYQAEDTSFRDLAAKLQRVLPDITLTFHLAGLFFTLDAKKPDFISKRGLNIGVKVYVDDQDFSLLLEARRSIAAALSDVPEIQTWLASELAKSATFYRPQISLLRMVPQAEHCPFGPLAGTEIGEILRAAADPINNYIGTVKASLKDFVLRFGIGTEMQEDPINKDISLG